jgi:hypothetical protein
MHHYRESFLICFRAFLFTLRFYEGQTVMDGFGVGGVLQVLLPTEDFRFQVSCYGLLRLHTALDPWIWFSSSTSSVPPPPLPVSL